ncbi:MAG: helix-turn-helix domain-containing protein [Duncaniella sp.]|nr:helix-turn-helix domain-containing protein [Duncaniella sp.]
MNPTAPNRLTRQERRLYDMLRRGGRYTVADITRELGLCDPRGHISMMRRKGIGIADKRVTRPDGVNYKLYWLAE